MAIFNYVPSYGSQLNCEPRLLEAPFGDGYSQRAGDGINTDPQNWPLVFEPFTNDEADAIEAFFKARLAAGGLEAFDWTPPFKASAKFICRSWSRSYDRFNSNTIHALFEQVFE
jgi:phage-related protein